MRLARQVQPQLEKRQTVTTAAGASTLEDGAARVVAVRGRRLPSGLVSPVILVGLAYVLLTAAWAVGNPPFAAPDEWAHQLRAIGVGRGDLIGERGAWPIAADASPARSRS